MTFENYAIKGNQILNEIAQELGFPEDRNLAGRMLRSVLHVLRERLTLEESFQLMAQLPMPLKAVYVEGWRVQDHSKRIKTEGEFVREVIKHDWPVGHFDIKGSKDGRNAIMAVLKVIRNHVSEGEIKDILASIPKDLHGLFGEIELENAD